MVKPLPTYEVKRGIIIQTLPQYNDCEDFAFKHTWNGSHFLIGPALTNYVGEYVMGLQNSSNMWENRSFSISISKSRLLCLKFSSDDVIHCHFDLWRLPAYLVVQLRIMIFQSCAKHTRGQCSFYISPARHVRDGK